MLKHGMILAATLVTSIVTAQSLSLFGTAKTSTNTPLKNVIVTLASNPMIADTTDARGIFSLVATTQILNPLSNEPNIRGAGLTTTQLLNYAILKTGQHRLNEPLMEVNQYKKTYHG